MTTFGWRASRRSVSRVWLKYASVYQPARIFSTGRSKISGWSRCLVICAMLELEARRERGLGDLQLLGRRLGRGQSVLQLVPGLRERLRQDVAGIACHPAEDLGRCGDRADLGRAARMPAEPQRREVRKQVSDRRRRHEWAHEVAAAALVLLLSLVAVLVAADRDVLGTVVAGELGAVERED